MKLKNISEYNNLNFIRDINREDEIKQLLLKINPLFINATFKTTGNSLKVLFPANYIDNIYPISNKAFDLISYWPHYSGTYKDKISCMEFATVSVIGVNVAYHSTELKFKASIVKNGLNGMYANPQKWQNGRLYKNCVFLMDSVDSIKKEIPKLSDDNVILTVDTSGLDLYVDPAFAEPWQESNSYIYFGTIEPSRIK